MAVFGDGDTLVTQSVEYNKKIVVKFLCTLWGDVRTYFLQPDNQNMY